MNFTHYDLGFLEGGKIVQVTLSGSAANVRLMDSTNFSNYRSSRNHHYRGGLITRSPARLAVPNSGHWHVTVDMLGLRGSTRSSVQVLPGAPRPLPPLNEAPLRQIPTLLREAGQLAPATEEPDIRRYDVFISHASEDKDEVVRPLALAYRIGQTAPIVLQCMRCLRS